MVPVIFETLNETPQTFADVLAGERRDRWCLDLYDCRGLFHGLSADGMRGLCLYEAPDAEAVRRALRHLGDPVSVRAWTAAAHYAPGYGRRNLPREGGPFAMSVHALAGAADVEGFRGTAESGFCLAAHRVDVIADFIALDAGQVVRLYAAPDLEAIRRACGAIPERDLLAAVAHRD